MKFLTDTDEIDIDVFGIIMSIDDIMHKEITDKTGITVSHRDIQKFIGNIVGENNREQRRRRIEREKLFLATRKSNVVYENKKSRGKVVKDLNSIGNKIKFYILGYIIIED
jgi:hypothetical protein